MGVSYDEGYEKGMYREQWKQGINPAERGKGFGVKKYSTENCIYELRFEGWVGIHYTRKGQLDQGWVIGEQSREGSARGINHVCKVTGAIRPGKMGPAGGNANAQ